MDSSTPLHLTIAVIGLATWLGMLTFQSSDLVASLYDVRSARDRESAGREARRHAAELVWTIPFVALLGLLLALGVDLAGRLFFEWNEPLIGAVVMVGLAMVAVFGGLGIVYAIVRREVADYASLRTDLRAVTHERITGAQLASFQNDLAIADQRQRRIRLRFGSRTALPRLRAGLEERAERFAVAPPTGLAAVTSIRWRVANAVFWRASFWRLLVVVVSTVPFFALLVYTVQFGDASFVPFVLLALLPPVVSFVLGLLGARFSLASKVAWHAVYRKQREDAVQLLTDLERASRKGVAGLGDRVARALQILREQQD